MSQKQQPDSRERLAEAISQEKSLNVCARHPTGTVYFDGPECPACAAIWAWLEMTEEHDIPRNITGTATEAVMRAENRKRKIRKIDKPIILEQP